MVRFLRSSPLLSSLTLPPLGTQPSLIHPLSIRPPLIPYRVVGSLVARPNAVKLPSPSVPYRPTRRALAASSDDGPLETATRAGNKLKEWLDALRQQPSHLPTTTVFWKKRAQQWMDAFETGFCMFFAALLIRMGFHVISALLAGAMLKLYMNMRREYRDIETQDMIDRIAHKQRSGTAS